MNKFTQKQVSEMPDLVAVKHFFATQSKRPVTMEELKQLTPEDKTELGRLARNELMFYATA